MIILTAPNKNWNTLFTQEKAAIISKTHPYNLIIEHIGSTAIDNIYAKPIIDILIGINQLAVADKYIISLIQSLGYDYIKNYEESMPQRRFFQKYDSQTQTRTHHIHLVEYGSAFWIRHIQFRDYLRLFPTVAKQYESLKLSLAPQYNNSNDYAIAKTDFISKIEQQAWQYFKHK